MSRRWITALAVAALFAVACFYLGQWQWHRHEDKAARAQRINSHYFASPVPLSSGHAETRRQPASCRGMDHGPRHRSVCRPEPHARAKPSEQRSVRLRGGGSARALRRYVAPRGSRLDSQWPERGRPVHGAGNTCRRHHRDGLAPRGRTQSGTADAARPACVDQPRRGPGADRVLPVRRLPDLACRGRAARRTDRAPAAAGATGHRRGAAPCLRAAMVVRRPRRLRPRLRRRPA